MKLHVARRQRGCRMADYTNAEKADMLLAYGAADCNGRAAQRLYAQRYPLRRTPAHTMFARLHQQLCDSGSFHTATRNRDRTTRTPANEETVLGLVESTPRRSTRGIANEIGISRNSVWRILHSNDMHPYHLQRVQLLEERDFEPRRDFAHWYLQKRAADPRFPASVLFTDEAYFTREGIFNTHNNHAWAMANPHAIRTRAAQTRFMVNVWAGIVGDHLVGPYLLPDRLTGADYLIFLEQVLPELLANAHVSTATHPSLWYQLDGAPAHFSLSVRNHLNATFGQRWIGRGGPVKWPARSPDLSCMDYFFWGHVKSLVYETPVDSVEDLIARIVAAAGEIQDTPAMFENVRTSMQRRCEACITCGGRQFEHLL